MAKKTGYHRRVTVCSLYCILKCSSQGSYAEDYKCTILDIIVSTLISFLTRLDTNKQPAIKCCILLLSFASPDRG